MLKQVLIVFLGLCLIVVGDTAGKLLTSTGYAPFFVGWARFIIAAFIILPLSGLKVSELSGFLNISVLFRAALITSAIISILTSLNTEPIANVFGAFFISPIVSYFLSAVLLKEKITVPGTILLFIGLLGVMLVVKPGFGASIGIVFALMAGCFHGTYLFMTRKLSGDFRPRYLLISQLIIGSVLLTPIGFRLDLLSLEQAAIWLILVSSLGSAAGNYFLVIASKELPGSIMAPLIYTQLIAATAAGYIVFDNFPDKLTFLGLILILISGLSSLVADKLFISNGSKTKEKT